MAVVFSYRGTRYYGEKVPVRGMKRDERMKEIRRRIDDKEWKPASDAPRKPRKPNPHKGKSCALWVDKEFNVKGAKPKGLEWNLEPVQRPKADVVKISHGVPRESNAPVPDPQIRSSHLANVKAKRGRPPKKQAMKEKMAKVRAAKKKK